MSTLQGRTDSEVSDSGRKYEKGDCVLLKSCTSFPFVAEITGFCSKKGKRMFTAVWFYRPSDIGRTNGIVLSKNELLYSNHSDCHSVDTIISKCEILPRYQIDPVLDEYFSRKDENLFICRYFYECLTGIYKNINIVKR
jgi:hypothetical protein